MYQKLHQLNDVYKNSLQNLGEFTHDYAAWDDTYAYILHPGKKYEASNLVPGTFATYDVDFVVYLNAGQQIVYGKQYNPITRKLENIQSTAWIRRYHLARLMRPGEKKSGLIRSGNEIYMVSAQPILKSSEQGPSRGTLIFGKKLDDAQVRKLSKIAGFSASLSSKPKPSENASPFRVKTSNEHAIKGILILNDLNGDPAATLSVQSKRIIYQKGQQAIFAFLITLLAVGAILLLALYFALDHLVVSRIVTLIETIRYIRQSDRLSARVLARGKDEIGGLAKEINGMLSSLQAYQQQLSRQAFYDPLTHLPNRLLLMQKLDEITKKQDGHTAILFLDLDGFKEINDTYGHACGDMLLVEVGRNVLRQLEEGDLFCRLGGDEFIMLLSNWANRTELLGKVHAVIREISRPVEVESRDVTVTVSIGISLYPDNGTDPEELIQKADEAMYRAKRAGKNLYDFYAF